jgi:hypothetical protein
MWYQGYVHGWLLFGRLHPRHNNNKHVVPKADNATQRSRQQTDCQQQQAADMTSLAVIDQVCSHVHKIAVPPREWRRRFSATLFVLTRNSNKLLIVSIN